MDQLGDQYEVIDLCDSDPDHDDDGKAEAMSSELPPLAKIESDAKDTPANLKNELESSPWVRLGTLKTRLPVLDGSLDQLPTRLIIKRNAPSIDCQLAVLASEGGLPVGYIDKDISQVFERPLIGDYVRLFGELVQNSLKRSRHLNSESDLSSIVISIVITVRPSFITSVVRMLHEAHSPFMCEPTIFAMIRAQSAIKAAQQHQVQHQQSGAASVMSTNTSQQDVLWKLFDSALSAISDDKEQKEPNSVIKTPLYPYQKAGLSWMWKREQNDVYEDFSSVVQICSADVLLFRQMSNSSRSSGISLSNLTALLFIITSLLVNPVFALQKRLRVGFWLMRWVW
jgi:hypothetical protein